MIVRCAELQEQRGSRQELPWLKGTLIGWLESKRRCPEANWFELVGSLGDEGDIFFRIGAGGPENRYRAPRTADRYAFANDLASKYSNNEGLLRVSVTRTG